MFGARQFSTSKALPRLPRGECRFILLHPEISGQRCCCQNFWHNEAVPGASCECGHQACYHEPELSAEGVSHKEHQALVTRVNQLEKDHAGEWTDQLSTLHSRLKNVEDTLETIIHDREDDNKEVFRAVRGVYQQVQHAWSNHAKWLTHHDDKVEAIVDKVSGFGDDVVNLRDRVIHIDDANMSLEDRFCELEKHQPTPKARVVRRHSHSIRRRRPAKSPSSPWSAKTRVTLLPFLVAAFDMESVAYSRCLSRGLVRKLSLKDPSARAIGVTIESAFKQTIAGHRWIPLSAKATTSDHHNPSTQRTLTPLLDNQSCSDLWDADFLAKHCAILDDHGHLSELYLTIRDDALPWEEIRRQPVFEEGLERCWEHNPTLDGTVLDDEALDVDPPVDDPERVPQETRSPTALPKEPLKRSFSSLSDELPSRSASDETTKRIKLGTSLPNASNSAVPKASPRLREVT